MTLVNADTGEIVRSLAECEDVIERGIGTFVEVGEALSHIRDNKLYRESFDTFESYCQERWGFVASRARQLIAAAETVTAVTAGGGPAPVNEAQARAAAPLRHDPPAAAEAMQKAAARTNGKPTAVDIAEAVAEKLKAKADDRAELNEVRREFQPDGFDEKEEERKVTERGQFSALCRDLSKLPAPATFLAEQRADLKQRHIDQAERAYAWLDEFLIELREAK